MGWQPIETAPRDGTWILGYYAGRNWIGSNGEVGGGHNCVVVRYRQSGDPKLNPPRWDTFGPGSFFMRDIRWWMPLPEPPEAANA